MLYLGAIRLLLRRILTAVEDIEQRLGGKPTRISFGYPIFHKNGVSQMPNLELPNDQVATIPILTLDAEGVAVPAPSGDAFTVAAAGPAGSTAGGLGAAISGSNVVLTPTVQVSPGWTVTVTDADGLTAATLTVDITADTTPKALSLGTPAFAAQAVPTAPGP